MDIGLPKASFPLDLAVGTGPSSETSLCLFASPRTLLTWGNSRAFSPPHRFWDDERHLWDRLLPEGREGAAARALDVPRVPQGWSLHHALWRLVRETFPIMPAPGPHESFPFLSSCFLFIVTRFRLWLSVMGATPSSLTCSCCQWALVGSKEFVGPTFLFNA